MTTAQKASSQKRPQCGRPGKAKTQYQRGENNHRSANCAPKNICLFIKPISDSNVFKFQDLFVRADTQNCRLENHFTCFFFVLWPVVESPAEH